MSLGSVLGGIAGGLFGAPGIGAAIGGVFDDRRTEKKASKQWQSQTIEGRVASAKRAGIHPLAALGAPINVSNWMGGQSKTGSMSRDAIDELKPKTMNAWQKQTQSAAIRQGNAAAERDEAEAAAIRSRQAREEQAANSQPTRVQPGTTRNVPSEVVSHAKGDKSVTAGKKPTFDKRVVGTDPKGKPIILDWPHTDEPGEMELGAAIMMMLKNMGVWDRGMKYKAHPRSKGNKQQRRYQRQRRRNRDRIDTRRWFK